MPPAWLVPASRSSPRACTLALAPEALSLPYQDGRSPHRFPYVGARQQSPQEAQQGEDDEGGAEDVREKLCAPC